MRIRLSMNLIALTLAFGASTALAQGRPDLVEQSSGTKRANMWLARCWCSSAAGSPMSTRLLRSAASTRRWWTTS